LGIRSEVGKKGQRRQAAWEPPQLEKGGEKVRNSKWQIAEKKGEKAAWEPPQLEQGRRKS
jgi:hypothetical protein